MWNARHKYTPGKLEGWSLKRFAKADPTIDPASEIGAMANLIPSVLKDYPWKEAAKEIEPIQLEFMKLLAKFNQNPSAKAAAKVVDLVMPRQDRFDSLWIGFWTLRRLFRENGIAGLSAADKRCLSYEKLWDFMEENPPGRITTERRIMSIRKKL